MPTSGELLVTTRRGLLRWMRTHLTGECIVELVSPTPILLRRGGGCRPKPAPRVGRIELAVRPGNTVAHERVVTRLYSLRLATPVQWVRREGFETPRRLWSRRKLHALWEPVGLDCGDFWCSARELRVRERPPRIDVIPPEYDFDAWSYAFAKESEIPPPSWWLATALEAGFVFTRVDSDGFPIPAGQSDDLTPWWTFAERNPKNLRYPLALNVHGSGDGSVRIDTHSIVEQERADQLAAALRAALERLPGLRIRSGNCDFSFAEWRRLKERGAPQEPAPDEPRDNVVSLHRRPS